MPFGFPIHFTIRRAPKQLTKEKAKAELAFRRNRRKKNR